MSSGLDREPFADSALGGRDPLQPAGMEEPEQRLRQALDAVTAAITVTDADGRVVEANAAACALAQMARGDIVGASLVTLARERGASEPEVALLASATAGQ